jgi:transposase InsO family protein
MLGNTARNCCRPNPASSLGIDLAGIVYVAFVIGGFVCRIFGWKVSRSARADFVLDALGQALPARRPTRRVLIYHSGRGVQYMSIRYAE